MAEENVLIPEKLVIGEVTYNIKETPELLKLIKDTIQKSAKIEKDKTYQTIQKAQADLNAEILLTSDLQQKFDEYKASNPPKTIIDPNKTNTTQQDLIKSELLKTNEAKGVTKEEVQAMISDTFKNTLPDALKNSLEPILKPITEKTQQLEKQTLTEYKMKRLTELGDTIVPELITGSSKEEIEASIVASAEVRKRYPVTPVEENRNRNIEYPGMPPKRGTPEEQIVDISKLTSEEFAKKRDELFNKIKGEAIAYQGVGNERVQ